MTELEHDFGLHLEINQLDFLSEPTSEEVRQTEIEIQQVLSGDDSGFDVIDAGVSEPIKQYLNNIGKIPLISADEEIVLAKKIEQGDTEAVKKLAEANLRLVPFLARKYKDRGLAYLDVIQAGNLGLLKAVQMFDWRKGFRFPTYGGWWIKQSMGRAIITDSNAIRTPVHTATTLNKIYWMQGFLTQVLERIPTNEEIAEALNIQADQVRTILNSEKPIVSLETPLGDDEGGIELELASTVIDGSLDGNVEQQALQTDMSNQLQEILASLNFRERRVIELRFGLHDGRERSLDEIGREFGLTRERVRQIQDKVFEKMKEHDQVKILHQTMSEL